MYFAIYKIVAVCPVECSHCSFLGITCENAEIVEDLQIL